MSTQLTVWLISVYGNSSAVADVGAASRLSSAIGFLGIISGMLIQPRFARSENIGRHLFWWFLAALGMVAISCLFIIAPFFFFPQIIDLVLGFKYSNIHAEVILAMSVASISLVSMVGFHLVSARGYVMTPYISVGVSLIAQISLIPFSDLTTAKGVLGYSFMVAFIGMVLNVAYGMWCLSRSVNR
jgi:hypothetical protein